MKNQEIARLLYEIADILEFQGVEFKPNAYRRAAFSIDSMSQDIEKLDSTGRLTEIEGVGEGIASKIHEFLAFGRSRYLISLRKGLKVDLEELYSIEGLGPKRIRLLYDKLGIKSIKDLKRAAKAGKIQGLPGMGHKEEQNILHSIEFYEGHLRRMDIATARSIAMSMIAELEENVHGIERIEYAGSLRRGAETIGDIDILTCGKDKQKIIDAFAKMKDVRKVLAKGDTKCSVILRNGAQSDLRAVDPASFGAALNYFTGSKSHNIELRKIAIKKGMKLNEYGVFHKKGKSIAGANEKEVYSALGMDYIEPEMRENTGEIEAAMKHRLPDLVKVDDLRGDLHVHSDWSDGVHTIRQMADAAIALGREYILLSDHTGVLAIAHGLAPNDFLKQWKEIDKLNKEYSRKGFRILKGCEVNIMEKGEPDLADSTLSRFDIVVGSIHHGYKKTKEQMTNRIINAMKNPHIDIIGHPSGRLINKREAYPYDLPSILDAAKDTGTHLEINSFPVRLDLRDADIREAKKAGVKMAISTDSHSMEHLRYMQFGVTNARRGWAEKKDILNTLSCDKLLEKIGK